MKSTELNLANYNEHVLCTDRFWNENHGIGNLFLEFHEAGDEEMIQMNRQITRNNSLKSVRLDPEAYLMFVFLLVLMYGTVLTKRHFRILFWDKIAAVTRLPGFLLLCFLAKKKGPVVADVLANIQLPVVIVLKHSRQLYLGVRTKRSSTEVLWIKEVVIAQWQRSWLPCSNSGFESDTPQPTSAPGWLNTLG